MKKRLMAVLGAFLMLASVGCASLDFFSGEKGEKAKDVVKTTIGLAVDVASLKYPAETKVAMAIVKQALDVAEATVQNEQLPVDELMKVVYQKVPADSDAGLYARIVLRRVAPLFDRFALAPDSKVIDKEKALEVIAFIREAVGAY